MHPEQLPLVPRRLLALAILLLLLGLAYTVLIMPLRAMSASYDQELAQLSQRIERAKSVLSEGRGASEQLRRLILAEKRLGYYLENNKPALAAAELQRRVKQTVEQLGGNIVSSQILGEQEDNNLHKVVLRVNLRMDLSTLEKILHALETTPPVLVLNNVSIAARPSGSTARWRGSVEQQVLDVSLDVMGYRKQGEG